MTARVVMIQGTASSVGKSLLVTMLCRYYAAQGLRVAPFKAQNMALNSAVTKQGHEIGRAQYVQALAARVEPHVHMNPILLKPEAERSAQVVVLGRSIGSLSATQYHAKKPELKRLIAECLEELRSAADVVVIEGAGSPAEVNLKERDIVNMTVAKLADAPVLLAGDIDRGGVFAAIVGTLALIEPDERERIKGFIINKFRGDLALLAPGLEFLENKTNKPVLGVVPFVPRVRIADEDSLSLDERGSAGSVHTGVLDIVIVRLPRISNFDDFDSLEHEPGVSLRFVDRAEQVLDADLVVVPGSKSTLGDLAWLRQSGIAGALVERARRRGPILGICGGCQMLGSEILDPEHVESSEAASTGLGLLPVRTKFGSEKRTAQTRAAIATASFLGEPGASQEPISGYEIHMGRVSRIGDAPPALRIQSRNGEPEDDADGAIGCGGAVVGSMLHGLLHDAAVRSALLRHLRGRRGLAGPEVTPALDSTDAEFDRLAAVAREHLNCDLLRSIVGI